MIEEFGNTAPYEQQQLSTNHIFEVFLNFVAVTDSRMSERQAVYVGQQQPLQDVLGPQVFGGFLTDEMAFVCKAQQIRDVGQREGQVSTLRIHTSRSADHVPGTMQLCFEDRPEVSVTWPEDVGPLTSRGDEAWDDANYCRLKSRQGRQGFGGRVQLERRSGTKGIDRAGGATQVEFGDGNNRDTLLPLILHTPVGYQPTNPPGRRIMQTRGSEVLRA